MQWVHSLVNVPFELPHLAQFNDRDRELYKEQVAARERHRGGAGEQPMAVELDAHGGAAPA